MLTPAQIEARRLVIGASEIHDAILSPFKLWKRKKLGIDQFREEADFIRLGNAFEPALRDHHLAGRGVWFAGTPGKPATWISSQYPWLCVTPDGVVDPDPIDAGWLESPSGWGPDAYLLEIKTSSVWAPSDPSQQWADGVDWTPESPANNGGVPERYRAQVVQGLGITGLPYAVIVRLHFRDDAARRLIAVLPDQLLQEQAPALLNGLVKARLAEIHTYRIDPEPELFRRMAAAAKVFVERYLVGDDTPPPESDDDEWVLHKRMYPRAGELVIDADEEGAALMADLIEAHAEAKRAEARLERSQLALARVIGNNKGIRSGSTVILYGNSGKGRRWTMPKGE